MTHRTTPVRFDARLAATLPDGLFEQRASDVYGICVRSRLGAAQCCRLLVTPLPNRNENVSDWDRFCGVSPECEYAVRPNRRGKIRVELGRAPG